MKTYTKYSSDEDFASDLLNVSKDVFVAAFMQYSELQSLPHSVDCKKIIKWNLQFVFQTKFDRVYNFIVKFCTV